MSAFAICLIASIIGSICGIGGGVIIKPLLDVVSSLSVQTISFLSGFTVLCMSSYNVIRSKLSNDVVLDSKRVTPVAIGAVIGGILGKYVFQQIVTNLSGKVAGMIQSTGLLILTIGTVIYTINKNKIKTKNIGGNLICILVGLTLGIMSSFLGIGGGPFNLVVLSYFFSMDTKEGAQNSLYIILFSQLASLFLTIASNTIPVLEFKSLILMAAGGIGGGILGRRMNKYLSGKSVNKLFVVTNILIIIISLHNIITQIS